MSRGRAVRTIGHNAVAGARRLDRLVFLPVLAVLIAIWGVVAAFTLNERRDTLERVQTQLGFTVATLADANLLAENAGGLSPEQISANRTAAIWRALLQYPTASIWLRDKGGVAAGEAPTGSLEGYIVAEETRGRFSVHAALPRTDALAEWNESAWVRAAILLLASLAFLFLTNLLARALKQRAIAERETAAAMQRLVLRDRALEAITQGITITDEQAPGSPIIYTNPAFAALTRYSTDEVMGRGPLSFVNVEKANEMTERMNVAHAEKRPWRLEVSFTRKDGTHFLNNTATSLILAENGDISYAVTVHEDVTEIRQREELLLEAQKMESVGQLTGGIAHDFNNLLTAIKSNAEDLMEDLKDQVLPRKQAEIVLQAANRGAGLVGQLMAFARKQQLQPQPVEVNELLASFSKLVRSTLPANIQIEMRKAEKLPPVFVDPGRLESALLNLCINSRDAMLGGGTITIETMNKILDADYAAENLDVTPGPYVLIAVTDTGSGMPAHVVEKAFTPFFTTKEVGKGTGLGLSMVYGFVKQSGGNAKIYSELGLGTVIKIYLPAMEGKVEQFAAQAVSDFKTLGNGSILLVEDDDLVRQSISNKLTGLGYDVMTSGSAHEAIETLKRAPEFNLVFSDVIMPGPMNGADLVREVRRRWPHMNVLLTSGYTESTVLGKIKLPEDVKLLSKPYSNAELAQVIKEAMAGRMALT